MKKGVKIKKYLPKDNSNEVLVIKENIEYKEEDISTKYIPAFYELLEDGLLYNCNFEDNIWNGIDGFENKVYIKFPFQLNPQFNNALKCYTILKLSFQYTSIGNAYKANTFISKCLLDTNFLNNDYLESFKLQILHSSDTDKVTTCYFKEFLEFINLNIGEEFIFALPTSYPKSKPRKLPCYKSIITFDFIIQDFIKNNDLALRNKFLPIIIWWELTKLIPMRPLELGILKRDCLLIKNNNEKHIKIERRKKKNGKINYQKIRVLTEIHITDNIYNLINEYLIFSDKYNTGDFLFSHNAYKSTLSNCNKVSNIDFIGMFEFRELLSKFFNEVITSIYGYTVVPKADFNVEIADNEIEKIQLGDTRHLAFCNMMLQKYNNLIIAQIGGHYTLEEQIKYNSHIDGFISSYTYLLTKSLRNKLNIKLYESKISNNINGKDKSIQKSILGDKFYTFRKVNGGRCSCENFPFECNFSGHLLCKYFIPDETLNIDIIKKELTPINNEIEKKVSYIKALFSDIIQLDKADVLEEKLKTDTHNLNSLIMQKSILQAYKLDLEEGSNE